MRMTDTHAYDPLWTLSHPYALIRAGEYEVGTEYRICRENGSGDDLLICPLSGRGVLNSGAATIAASPGFLYLYEDGAAQDYGTDPEHAPWHFLWCHFHPPLAWRGLLETGAVVADGLRRFDLARLSSADSDEVISLVSRAVGHSITAGSFEDELAMNALERAFLLCGRAASAVRDPDTAFIEHIRAHVLRSLKASHTTPQLAGLVGLSPSHLMHKFKAKTGLSVQGFVEICRLEFALRLLTTTDMPVKAVAFDSGFADPLYFTRRFSKHFGFPPSKAASQRTETSSRG